MGQNLFHQAHGTEAEGGGITPAKQKKGFRLPTKSPLTKRQKALLHAVTLLETLHPAGGVDQLLLAGVERMTGGTDFGVDFRLGGPSLENVAAETLDGHVSVVGMDTFFHVRASYCYGNAPVANFVPER
jgi:hypothetical protein